MTLESYLSTYDAGNLLDIACGAGAFTKRLADNCASYAHITGIDIKADARDDFLTTVPGDNVTFIEGRIQDYIYQAGTFDTISVSNALHHLEDVGDVLKDIGKLLERSGTLIVNEMHRDGLTPSQQTQHDQHRFLAELQTKAGEHHRETWSKGKILGFVSEAQMTVEHTFENLNRDADVVREPGRLVERAERAIPTAYPAGAPPEVTAELERLVKRNEEIGSSPPPQLTLICKHK